MNFSYNGKTDDLFAIQEGFVFPSFTKNVQYRETTHSNLRNRIRHIYQPFDFEVPIILTTDNNRITRDEVTDRLNRLLMADGPSRFEPEDTDWYFLGEFGGPYYIPPFFDKFTEIQLQFSSRYSHKFYDIERTQTANKTVTINTKSQLPVTPLIELTGLTGDDVQVSISGDSFRRIRLTGNLPSNLTIDIPNERIYETNSGLDRLNLLRFDSAFEDFRIEDSDVVVLTNSGENAQARLTYKELLL